MKKYINIIVFSALILGLNSCKGFLDINYDPNSPSEENLTSDMVVPAVEMNIAATYSYTLHVLGAYNVQYYAQQFGTPNYVAYSQFNVSPSNGSGAYTQLFQRALGNLNTVKAKAEAEHNTAVALQVAVLRSYAYHLLVDAFGEVPFSEAFDLDNLAPKFDDGQVIYEALIDEIDEALDNLDGGDQPATSYIIPSGNLTEWVKFANGEKLRLLSRLSSVKDVSSDIQAVIDGGLLPTADVKIAGCWSNASGQANPFFSEEAATWGRATNNMIANLAIVSTMKQEDYTDPRLAAWFHANASNEYQGSISGTNLSTVEDKYADADVWCSPVIEYNTPVVLCALAEVEFFEAEFYARKGDASNAAAHYAAAIEASFESAGVSGASGYVAQFPFNQSKWQESIGVAKWVALAGVNGFEGYTEARRLNFPAFGSVKASDMYSGSGTLDLTLYEAATLYTPFQRFDQVGDNHLLERFPYPECSTARNSNAPEFPGYLVPIFWGVN